LHGKTCSKLTTADPAIISSIPTFFVPRFSPLVQLIAVSMAGHVALTGARVATSLYALSLHATEFTVGALIALFALLPMIFAVPMGRLIDRIGIKKPVTCGCIAVVIGCAIPALLNGLLALYPAVMLIGTGFMAIHIGSQHAVGAMSSVETRSANFAWLALAFSISSFLGPVIAGLVIDHVHFAMAYAICSGFALLALGFVACSSLDHVHVTGHGHGKAAGSTLDLLRNPDMRRIYLVGILLASAWDLFTFVTPIYGTRMGFSASTIGLVLGCFSIATFTIRLAMPIIARYATEWQVLTAALVLAVISYAMLPFMQQPASMMAVAATLGLALGSSQSNVLTLLHYTAPAGRAGEAIGIRATIGNTCQVVLPLAFGAAGATLGLFTVFWGIGAMIGAGIPVAWRKAFAK
jgi:predicted MFS family arabinose efflux permease